ncbi:MAG: DMT family transporter [Sphingopyxis sp.]
MIRLRSGVWRRCSALRYYLPITSFWRGSRRNWPNPPRSLFFQTLTILVTLGFAAPWVATLPALRDWPLITGAALLAVVSLHLLSWAYARAEAQILIPVEYTAFIWAAICGWVFFDEALSWPIVGGTVLIICGCLIAARANPQPQQVEEAIA